ncbi:MAG: GntR family transcriptional regulator [Bryobacterales bacterium]|nr:GntR family transcriptional regulator [Acidobacteriota bacterium]MCB9383533.1 GntR family transcriptional regulator [Bryobacterales bacterium]
MSPTGNTEKAGEVDRVYRLLKSWILEARLKPGEFVSEVEMARQCETSRTPVREAFNLLSQEKWIQRIRHRGYLVPAISIREIVETYEYRKLLEGFTAEKTAHSASPEEIEKLAAIVAVEMDPNPDPQQFLEANDAFHLELARLARNQRVLDQLQLVLEYVHRLDVLSTLRDRQLVPHGEIIRALRDRKPDEARAAMAAHVDVARDRMLKLFGS